jgi:hypothetical protein
MEALSMVKRYWVPTGHLKDKPSPVASEEVVNAADYQRLEAALESIAAMGGMTLLGGRDLDPERAYQHGANSAFGQAAEMARSALTPASGGTERG